MTDNASPEEVLSFWFGENPNTAEAVGSLVGTWFGGGPAFDDAIRASFGALPDAGLAGELDGWRADPQETVALVLVLDQFPRNLFRGSAQSFRYDARGLEIAKHAIERGWDQEVTPLEALFFYLPFEHSEDLADQQRCLRLVESLVGRVSEGLRPSFEGFVSFAERHLAVVERFGRFPHRNEALGRTSTAEEEAFLSGGGDTFGGESGDNERTRG